MGLFLDLIHVPTSVTNQTLDGLYKALSDGHGSDDVWKPHNNPLISRLIELFTQRGLDHLDGVKAGLQAWLAGHKFNPSPVPALLPAGMLQRWSADELALTKLYLENLPVALWTVDDHMLCIDMLVQTHLPPEVLQSEAEWLTTRAGLMGKVQANLPKDPTLAQADAILVVLPSTVAGAAAQYALKPAQRASLDFARVRAAENVRALSESVRHTMRGIVADDLEQKAHGAPPAGASSLQTKLFDAFAVLNRDWRRIAVTEAGEALNQGFIASLAPGSKVKRAERYDNACAFCRKTDGVVVTVVSAGDAKKDPNTTVWPGKNNLGRSASPRKRVGNLLVEREPHECWQIPAGLVHPHCRGRWLPVLQERAGDDPVFAQWLSQTLAS